MRESKGDTEQAVALLVAGNKAMKMMTGRKRTSTQPVPKSVVCPRHLRIVTRVLRPTPVRIVIKEYHLIHSPNQLPKQTPPKRKVASLHRPNAMELAREAMKAAKERKARSQMNLLDGLEEDGETKSSSNEFKNQELFQYLKELTSSSRKGGRRCSTYAKVKDALIEKFGESVFKADKSQVQEYLRTGGKGPAPSLPPTKEEEEEVESYTIETSDSKRIGLICRADGRVMWKRNKDSNLPKLNDLFSINKIVKVRKVKYVKIWTHRYR